MYTEAEMRTEVADTDYRICGVGPVEYEGITAGMEWEVKEIRETELKITVGNESRIVPNTIGQEVLHSMLIDAWYDSQPEEE